MRIYYNVSFETKEIWLYRARKEGKAITLCDLLFNNKSVIITKHQDGIYYLDITKQYEDSQWDPDDNEGNSFEPEWEHRFENNLERLIMMHLDPDERLEVRKAVIITRQGIL